MENGHQHDSSNVRNKHEQRMNDQNTPSMNEDGVDQKENNQPNANSFQESLYTHNLQNVDERRPQQYETPGDDTVIIKTPTTTIRESSIGSLAGVIIGAQLGVLIRIGLDTMTKDYVDVLSFPSFYSEFFGCIIMGIAMKLALQIKAL